MEIALGQRNDDLESITQLAYTRTARKGKAAVKYLSWLATDEERDLSRFARHVLISTGMPGSRTKSRFNTEWERQIVATCGEEFTVEGFMDDMGNYDLQGLHYYLDRNIVSPEDDEEEYAAA